MANFVGPQVNIPVGAPETPGSNIGAWQGLTIKEILEKVDLSNIIMDEDSKTKVVKEDPMINHGINPESAFLGPKLWSRSIPMPMTGESSEDFSVMNIDDFLSENGFDLNDPESPPSDRAESPRSSSDMDMDNEMSMESEMPPMKKAAKRMASLEPRSPKMGGQREGGNNGFLYVESKRAKMEREREEKRKRAASEIEFSPQELALATVPGMAFDPKSRRFAPDELRPQPIIRKRKKSFVPQDSKDDKYWEKREKNNIAARRSREARRLKENQIALRTAFLEKENNTLKAELDQAKAENMELVAEKQMLLEKLKQYE